MTNDEYRVAIADLGRTIIDLNNKFASLLEKIEAPSWITAKQAEDKYGMTNAQLRYSAKSGLIKAEKMGTVTLYLESDVIRCARTSA